MNDERLGMTHENLLELAKKLGDEIIQINVAGKVFGAKEGLLVIRNVHEMYPRDESKHPEWAAMGKKYVYFTSSYLTFIWLNYIPRNDLSGFVPESYGQDQAGLPMEALYE